MIHFRRELLTIPALAVSLAAAAFAAEPAAQPTGPSAAEQQAMMATYLAAGTPGPQHDWLAGQAGSYETTSQMWMAPGAPPMESKGTVERKVMLGKRVLTESFKGNVMGQAFEGYGMTGYDNVSGKYWTSWIDSMSTGTMTGTGDCDDKGACSFQVTTNDALTKAAKLVRLASRWTSPTEEIFEMFETGPDGKEMKTMEITYRKKK
jgi:hypothetical protein